MNQQENRPDFNSGDEVAPNETSEYDAQFYDVKIRPYKVGNDWYMVVKNGACLSREVACKSFHLVGERQDSQSNLIKEWSSKMKLSKPAIITGVVLLIDMFFGLWFAGNYNNLVSSKAQVDNSWASVEVQYQRRLDLIDNLVSSVKGSQTQEQKVFGDIAKARTAYNSASSTNDKVAAASQIETNVALIPKLQEAYPELKSNVLVQSLMAELSGTENSIATARDGFNKTATNYNVNIARFPKNMFAGWFGYDKQSLFTDTSGASVAPKVNL